MKKKGDFTQSYDHQAYVMRYCAKVWLISEDTSAASQISDEEKEQTSHKEMEQPPFKDKPTLFQSFLIGKLYEEE